MQPQGMLEFFVAGSARPKGSHRGFIVAGRVVMAPDSKGERGWRSNVEQAARAAMQGLEPLQGCVQVEFEFYSLRPKSHYGKRGRKPGVQLRPTAKPDWDKLSRSVGDALNGICYRDDALVCDAVVRKRYTTEAQPYCGVRIRVGAFVGEE
jgi:Holliday junction resolvase RusA-like endonuclease